MRDILSNVKVVEVAQAQTGGVGGTEINQDVDITGFRSAAMIVSTDDASQETVLTADKAYTVTGSGVAQAVNFDPDKNTVNIAATIAEGQVCSIVLLLGSPRTAPVTHDI